MKLRDYYGKSVIIKTPGGKIFKGVVDLYTQAADNPSGKESIGIMPIEFEDDEIASIELI